jgi:DeoR/GlpR family transcriptional regulator of sugar metabolism
VQKKLSQHFGVSDETIRRALRYSGAVSNTLHKRIREEAFRLGGQEIVEERPIH